MYTELQRTGSRAGGRISSDKSRTANDLSDNFKGLPAGTSRYDLLLLVKRLGKKAGFTPKMIMLLDYYMAFTRDIDWEQGGHPVIYQSLSKTALDLGVTERQIQRLEKQLFEASALSWHDSGNHRRFGQRDQRTGKILYAYGADLSPLLYLQDKLQEQYEKKQLYDAAWMETKRQISYYRAQIKARLNELDLQKEGQGCLPHHSAYKEISYQIRTHIKLDDLRDLLKAHKTLYEKISKCAKNSEKTLRCTPKTESLKTKKESPISEKRVTHLKYSTHKQSNKLEGAEKFFSDMGKKTRAFNTDDKKLDHQQVLKSAGLAQITLKQCLLASSDRLRVHLPLDLNRANWNEFIEAAYKIKGCLNISQKSWARACICLGRVGAAICIMLTDQALSRDKDPIKRPAAYFAALISRAEQGKLHLDQSIISLLKADV